MIDSSELAHIMIMNTIGLSIISQALMSAAILFNGHPKSRIGRESYIFIQGSGLEETLISYGIDYDANTIRNGFNYYVRHIS